MTTETETEDSTLDSSTEGADERQSWPLYFAVIVGGIGIVIGACSVLLTRNPFIAICAMVAAILILWVCGKNKNFHVTTDGIWLFAVLAAIVGLLAWVLGTLTGTWLVDLLVATDSGLRWLVMLLTYAVPALGSIAVLVCLGLGPRRFARMAAFWLIVIPYGLTIMFMTQHGISMTQEENRQEQHFQQQEENLQKLEETCNDPEYATLFPSECG